MVHIVRQGDSVISLSKRYGVSVDKILNHPDNSRLRERKRNASTLFPGDRLTIPDKEIKEETGATEQRHQFQYLGGITRFRVRFRRKSEPRSNEPYRLIVNNQEFSGNLDDEGGFDVRVPCDAREAILFLGEEGQQERFVLKIGHLNPLSEISGVQHRLRNLGFPCGREDNDLGPKTRASLRSFQEREGLQVTGEMDEATQDRLREVHGS